MNCTYSQQAYILENKLCWWPRHVGEMWTWSAIMVRVYPHICRSAFYKWPM